MLIYWSSKSGNTLRFVRSLGIPHADTNSPPNGRFVLVTPTVGNGDAPEPAIRYMDEYGFLCAGVIAGGNRSFGSSFAGAGKYISSKYDVPFLYSFELFGTEDDISLCRAGICRILGISTHDL